MSTNASILQAALTLALADEDFMGNSTKVNKAVEALTPKDGLTKIFKQLQGNALKDFLVSKEIGKSGYTAENKDGKIREYISTKFKGYMEDPKTAVKATELFYAAYPPATEPPVELGQAA